MMSNTVKEALKGAKVIVYARVSTGSQKKTLDNQVETVMNFLKSAGYEKEPLPDPTQIIYYDEIRYAKSCKKLKLGDLGYSCKEIESQNLK